MSSQSPAAAAQGQVIFIPNGKGDHCPGFGAVPMLSGKHPGHSSRVSSHYRRRPGSECALSVQFLAVCTVKSKYGKPDSNTNTQHIIPSYYKWRSARRIGLRFAIPPVGFWRPQRFSDSWEIRATQPSPSLMRTPFPRRLHYRLTKTVMLVSA